MYKTLLKETAVVIVLNKTSQQDTVVAIVVYKKPHKETVVKIVLYIQDTTPRDKKQLYQYCQTSIGDKLVPAGKPSAS